MTIGYKKEQDIQPIGEKACKLDSMQQILIGQKERNSY